MLQTQPKQQLQKRKEALLQNQPKQLQQQQQKHGQPQADHAAVPTVSDPMSLVRHCAAAVGSDAQQTGLDPGRGITAEAGQDMPFSQQSHVSASPCTSKSDQQPTSQQLPHRHHTFAIAETAAQSSSGTGASRGCRDFKPETDQPVLHKSTNLAETAATACHQGLLQAAPADVIIAEAHQSLKALQGALEPAGPLAGALSGGHALPASIDKPEQLPQQLAKHGANVSKAGGQKHKSTPHAFGPKGLGQRTRLQDTGGRAVGQNLKSVSCEASAAPAESQQSAVHALRPAPLHHSMPMRDCALKRSLPAVTGQTHLGKGSAYSKAKRSKTEVTVGLAGVKDVEQTRKRGRAHSGTMPPTSNISPLENQVGTGSPQILSNNSSQLQGGDGGLGEAAEEEVSLGMHLSHAPRQGHAVSTQSPSIEHQPKGCGRTNQSRPLRKRDSDANKPWWVV